MAIYRQDVKDSGRAGRSGAPWRGLACAAGGGGRRAQTCAGGRVRGQAGA